MRGVFGIGRPRDARARPCVEDVPALDVLRLARAGVLDADGTGELRCGDSTVAYRVHGDVMELAFVTAVDGVTLSETRQAIALVATVPPFGGRRWWFACPACGVMRTKLYLAETAFACRACAAYTYRSVQRHDKRVDALRRRPDRVRAVLAGEVAAGATEYHLALRAAAAMGTLGGSPEPTRPLGRSTRSPTSPSTARRAGSCKCATSATRG